jgi:magnesium-transporting ATPase (P-type)
MLTEIGKINAGVQHAKESHQKTPLAEKLDDFGQTLTQMISVICILVWVSNIPKFRSPVFQSKGIDGLILFICIICLFGLLFYVGLLSKPMWITGAIYYAKVAVALGVAAIPEGLPDILESQLIYSTLSVLYCCLRLHSLVFFFMA